MVDEGNSGFLGIGARDARILVEVDADVADVDDGAATAAELVPSSDVADVEERADVEESADAEPGTEPDLVATVASDSTEPEEPVFEPVPEELLSEVKDLVTSVVGEMGLEARVDVYDAEDYIAVDVASPDTALFIGQKGETIDALQYLVNAAIYKRREFAKRIILDAEGYRQRRVEAIQGMAHRTARKAVRERRTVEMPPMNPAERRVVHMYLKDDPKVTTLSEGAGSNRRVRVSPV